MPLRRVAAYKFEKINKMIINMALKDLPMDGGIWGKAEFDGELG